MELWQMDVTLGVHLADGSTPSVVTGIDDHSRFCICARVVARATAKPVGEALLSALAAHGVPDAILSDNGKVFTGRFGPATGEVLFDRICRENGIRHLLTAPASPTTTGKVERFHKTMKREFLDDKVFETIDDAQEALDGWVHEYNHQREHQSLGDRPPVERFRLSCRPPEVLELPTPEHQDAPLLPVGAHPRVTRRVLADGKVSLLRFKYHVGRWLAGEIVELVSRDGLIEIFHRGVLVATHARRHLPEHELRIGSRTQPRPATRSTTGPSVTRKVDTSGSICFAGSSYRVGNTYKHRQVDVAVVRDSVQISVDGKLVRTHPVRHDRRKEHGAFANPGGRPRRINAA
jgi:Integrase core domain